MSRLVRIDLIDTPLADLRDHQAEHIAGLKDDIERNGLLRPLLVYPKRDGRFDLIGGHARLAALVALGKREVAIQLHSTASTDRARVTAACSDNNHAEWSPRDKARAAWLRFPDETIQGIAEIAGVGKGTSERARDELIASGDLKSHVGNEDRATRENTRGQQRPRTYKPREKAAPAVIDRPADEPNEADEGSDHDEPWPLTAGPPWQPPDEDESAAEPTHADNAEPEAPTPKRHAAPPRRPYTSRMKTLIAAANDASDATDEEIAGIPANDLMLHGLRNARDLLDRIIESHTKKERKHG